MSQFDFKNVSTQCYDVLREIGNIGAGNAATALSQMISCRMDMSVPRVRLLDFKEVGMAIGGEEQIMVGVYLTIKGDITGSIMFFIDEKSAHALVEKMTMMPGQSDGKFTEFELSALGEIGNIITGSYLNSISMLTNLRMYPSIPALCVDMAGAILSVPAIEFGEIGDKILLIQSRFSAEKDMDGYFVLVPDVESYEKIMKALGL